jgi:hypothetical protein
LAVTKAEMALDEETGQLAQTKEGTSVVRVVTDSQDLEIRFPEI